jgi:RNA polymerase sigma-70 factor (ECF subfamily)
MLPSLADDEIKLIARAKCGDLEAFETLYGMYKGPIYRTGLAITGDRLAAEEILQEAFLRAFRHMHNVREGVSLSPWLQRIAVNLAYDYWAARRRHWQVDLDGYIEQLIAPAVASPEQTVEERELYSLVYEAIDRLEFRQRVTLTLFYLHDFSLTEVAEIMECPVGTVKSRLHHARENLRRELLADQRLPQGLAYEFT